MKVGWREYRSTVGETDLDWYAWLADWLLHSLDALEYIEVEEITTIVEV